MKSSSARTDWDLEWFAQPIEVRPMRVRRTYRGGSRIDLWHHQIGRYGETRPEEWLASTTGAINPGFPPEMDEGLSRVCWQGKEMPLRDLICQHPDPMLGAAHRAKFGENTGILAKIIDSSDRLSIQVHPDKAFSRRWFHSEYGKTECWYILDAPKLDGEDPYLLMGFRPGVTREKWEQLYRIQNVAGMIDSMHRVTPKAGEVWLIEGGFPHAIGPGCFLLELQEPTDYTLRIETTKADGSRLPDQLIHQGAGDKGLMECFHYDTADAAQIRARHCIVPSTTECGHAGVWRKLVGKPQTDCFSMGSAVVQTALQFPPTDAFAIGIVLTGKGKLLSNGKETPLYQGCQLFFPAAMGGFAVVNDTPGQTLELLFCYPPGDDVPMPEEKC